MLAHSVLAFALLVLAPASEGSDRTAESATSGQTPMVLAVETARGLYTLSTGTTEFE